MDSPFRRVAPCPLLAPVPVVMAAVGGKSTPPNIITLAWVGTVCSKPPMLSISVRKERYSYGLILETGEFTVNLADEGLLRPMDFCGVKSGRDTDKFKAAGLTPISLPEMAYAPGIREAPVILCCKVASVQRLGSHDLFLAEITGVYVRGDLMDDKGAVRLDRVSLVGYSHGVYQTKTGAEGFFGFSVARKRVLKKRARAMKQPGAGGGKGEDGHA